MVKEKEFEFTCTKFSGKKEDWYLWEKVFKAKMLERGLLETINGDPEKIVVKVNELGTKEEKKKEVKEMNKNIKAYAIMLSVIDMKTPIGRSAMKLVGITETSTWPNGNSAKAWANLKQKYEPVNALEKTREKMVYINIKMKEGQDPDSFLNYLESKRERLTQLGASITDEDFLADLMSKLPKSYESIIERMADLIDEKKPPAEIIELVREKMRAKHMRNKRNNKSDDEKAFITKSKEKRRRSVK